MSALATCVRLALVSLLASACAAGDRATTVTSVRDSAGVRIVENHPERSADSCSFAPALSIGVMDGAPEYQLFRVMDATRLSDGRIAVVNQGSDEIRVYDGDGAYVLAFGGSGGGPGEFRDPFLIWHTRGDTIVVAEEGPWRFHFFTPDGAYVRTVRPEPLHVNVPGMSGLLADGGFVLGDARGETPAMGFQPRLFHLTRYDHGGVLLDTIGVYPTGRWGFLSVELRFIGGPLFEPVAVADAAGETIVVGPGHERELQILDPTGRITSLVRWSGPDRSVSPREIELYREALLARVAGRPASARRFIEPQISEDRPVSELFPAHGAISLAMNGDIWVHEYPRPSWGEDDDRWLVFGPDGRFVCHARTPAEIGYSWDVHEIGGDYLLANVRDDADVEHVSLYRLTRP